jgi:hypothetical protein
MKKLRLKALSLGAREILNREQLKAVTGGCNDNNDCYHDQYCNNYGECIDGGGGSKYGSGTGGCPEGTYNCYCNGGLIGCLSDFDCTHTSCV